MENRIIDKFLENGYMITPDSLKYLISRDSKIRENLINTAIYKANSLIKKPIVITKEFLMEIDKYKDIKNKEALENKSEIKKEQNNVNHQEYNKEQSNYDKVELTSKRIDKYLAKDIEPIVKIERDPTGNIVGSGKIDDLHKYFLDRYNSIKKIFMKRRETKDFTPINQLNKEKDEVKIIGIVTDKRQVEDKNGKNLYHFILELEDLESQITVIIPSTNTELLKQAEKIVLDQIICIKGVYSNNFFRANEIYFPDIPLYKHINKIQDPIHAALLSDIHFGSKKFMSEKFLKFIDWLKGDIGTERQKQLAKSIKYILIAGDLIDGVGVYPGQEKNLSIIDIKEQYEQAYNYLNLIPDYINIIIIPGGAHDAVRKALPQEAIPRKYAKSLYSLENTIILGNPCFLSIHGMKTIMYHGEGLDDIIPSIPGMSYQRGDLAMIEFLRSRHLSPIYGNKVGIAPEPFDWMVIREVPDLLLCGHSHVTRVTNYKGVTVVNSGTFQDETDYQQSLGIKPTPAIVPIISLTDFTVVLKKF